jgi:integrase
MGVKVKERKGAWWIFVNHKGKRKAKRVGEGKEGYRAALAVAETLQARLVLGDYSLDEPKPVTLRDYAEVWLNTYVSANLKAGTQEKYAEVLRKHWFPKLGDTPIQSMSRAQIKTILSEKLSSHAKSTVTLMIDVLRGCLNAAVEDQLLTVNPAAKLGKVLPQGQKKKEIDIFAPGTLSFLLATAELKTPEIYPQILLLARTGMRIGEALALKVEDVDFDNRVIWIRLTWGSRKSALGLKRLNSPKSGSERRADMSKQLSAVLSRYLKQRSVDSPWLFPSKQAREGPMHPTTFLRHWKALMTLSALTYRKPHTLRHTYASMLIQNGENLLYVRDQLGHSSIKITIDTYGHLIPSANKAAVDRLDEVLTTRRNLYATKMEMSTDNRKEEAM